MSVVRRIQIGENHKSAEVLNRPTDDIQTLSGLTLGATFAGFATVPALAAEATARANADALALAQWGPTKAIGGFTGRNYTYAGGTALVAGVATQIANGSLVVPDNAASYIERTYAGVVSTNTAGFTSGSIPMARVTAASGAITAVEDWRPMFGPFPYYAPVAGEVSPSDLRFPIGEVRRHGAVLDGTSNDTVALTNACASVKAISVTGGRTVTIPPNAALLVDVGPFANAVLLQTNCTILGGGYTSVIKINPASYSADGTYHAIVCQSNTRIANLRIDGNRGAVNRTGLTAVATTAVYGVTGSTDVDIEDLWAHDILGIVSESFGVLSPPAAQRWRMRRCKGWNCEGTPFSLNGRIETVGAWNSGSSMASDCELDDVVAYNNTWQGVSIYGVKNSRASRVRAFGNAQNGVNVEWSQDIDLHDCEGYRNGFAGLGTFGNVIRVRDWDGTYYENNTGNSASLGDVTLADGSWSSGSPAPRGVAVSVELHRTAVRPTSGNAHLFVKSASNTNTTYVDDTGATVAGRGVPVSVVVDVPDALAWLVRGNLGAATDGVPGLSYPALQTRRAVHTREMFAWQKDGSPLTNTALDSIPVPGNTAGAGGSRIVSTVAFQTLTSAFALRQFRYYLVRYRVNVRDTTGWTLAHQDSGFTKPERITLPKSAVDVDQWHTGEAIFHVSNSNPTQLVFFTNNTVIGSTTLDVDYCHVMEILPAGSSGDNGANLLTASGTWDPPSVAAGAMTSTTLAVTGAAKGDSVAVGFSTTVPAGMILAAQVTATNTVTVTLLNMSGSTQDLASGTLRVDVWQH